MGTDDEKDRGADDEDRVLLDSMTMAESAVGIALWALAELREVVDQSTALTPERRRALAVGINNADSLMWRYHEGIARHRLRKALVDSPSTGKPN